MVLIGGKGEKYLWYMKSPICFTVVSLGVTMDGQSKRGLVVCSIAMVVAIVMATGSLPSEYLETTLRVQPPGSEFLETKPPVGSHVPGEVRFYFGYQLPSSARGLVAAAVVGRSIRVTGCTQGTALTWTPMGKVTQGEFRGFGFFVSQGCKPNANEVVLTLQSGVPVSKNGDLLAAAEVVWVR